VLRVNFEEANLASLGLTRRELLMFGLTHIVPTLALLSRTVASLVRLVWRPTLLPDMIIVR